ncbi:MAG: membrane protein insertase YidC, partial [Armatimonadota bacterium]
TLVQMNADVKDNTIVTELPAWERKFKAEAETNKLPAAEVDAAILKAHVLVADTKLKSALWNPGHAHSKLSKAYDILKATYEKDKDTKAWNEPVAIPADEKDPATSYSASQLYTKVVADLSAKNKTELVWGFVPGYQVIDFLVAVTGRQPGLSYAFAAFLLALVVRGAVWPLSQKQYVWGRKMQQLQPMLKELEANFKDKKTGIVTDQAGYQQATMKLYGEYGMNPFSGCGPALIQIPFFFTIFQCMQMYRFEFTHGTFLWINPTSTKLFNIPLAPNLGERDMILVFVYGVTMVITTLLTPVSDPTQMRQQRIMGLVFAVGIAISMFFYPLASAFILYWIFTNIMATGQSLMVNRMKLPPLEKVATPHGGILPTNGKSDVAPDFFTKTGSSKANKKKITGKSTGKVPTKSATAGGEEPESQPGLMGWLQKAMGQSGRVGEDKND